MFDELYLFVDCCLMLDGVVVSGRLDSRTIHRTVFMHLLPLMIIWPLYQTSTPIPHFVNDTSHPTSQSFTTEVSEYDAKSGMIWHSLALLGSCGMSRSPMCVECTWSPSGSVTDIGDTATCLLVTGAPTTRKWLLAPESNIYHSLMFFRLISTVYRCMFCGGWCCVCKHCCW